MFGGKRNVGSTFHNEALYPLGHISSSVPCEIPSTLSPYKASLQSLHLQGFRGLEIQYLSTWRVSQALS